METLDYVSHPKRKKRPPSQEEAQLYFRVYVVLLLLVLLLSMIELWRARIDLDGASFGITVLVSLFSLGSTGVLFSLWLLRMFIYKESAYHRLLLVLSFMVPAIIFAGTCTILLAGIPFRIAFWFSRSGLEKAVAEVRVVPHKGTIARTVRLLPVESIDVDGATATVVIAGAESFDTRSYLQWVPAGGKPTLPSYRTEDLGNGWFWVNH